MSNLTPERKELIRARLAAATDGPWAAWTDQDGTRHMGGMLMVGVEAGVIPDGETWVEGADVNNPVAHTYTPEDRELIANAPADLADLLAELNRLRGQLADAWDEGYVASGDDILRDEFAYSPTNEPRPNPYREGTES